VNYPKFRQGHGLLHLVWIVAALALLWWFHEPLLGWFGTYLDAGGPPRKADAILVLAGGWTGERVLLAGELVRQGYAPVALLSDPVKYYGQSECDLARAFAVSRGYEARLFECLTLRASSTREEALTLTGRLRARGVRSYLLVSVKSHLRRATRMFRSAAPDLDVRPVGAESPLYDLRHWYRRREGWKAVTQEWVKLVTSLVGI
jgi:uncharacterized SAM-binding protein YcdF (DUF218 family)